MRKTANLILILTIVAPVTSAATGQGELRPVDLRCEYRTNPLGIDVPSPRLSWKLEAISPAARGLSQSAYRLLAASSQTLLERNTGDLWDSGKVTGDTSIQIAYQGKKLASGQMVWWKVQIWDNGLKASKWSETAYWSMGLLTASDWKGKWIGFDGGEAPPELDGARWITAGKQSSKAIYLRRTFEIPQDAPISDMIVSVVGTGATRFTVNNRFYRDGKGPLTPMAVDVTGLAHSGLNVVSISVTSLGSEPAATIGFIELNWPNGRRETLFTDQQWRGSSAELPDWKKESFNDAAWEQAKVLGPYGMTPWGKVDSGRRTVLPARYLRKEFAAPAAVKRATLYVSGLGLFEAYLNGKKAGDDALVPAVSQFDKRVFYRTYDVTRLLRPGANALGVILGNGRYFAPRQWMNINMRMFGFPKLMLQLEMERADGSIERVCSDGTWKITTEGPIRENNEYDGEVYDARKEMPGWNRVGFPAVGWQSAQWVEGPGGVISAQPSEASRVTQTVKPISAHQLHPGVFIFDMGQNMVGWCRLKVKSPVDNGIDDPELTLRFAEKLHKDGELYVDNLRSAEARDTYIRNATALQVYEPRFTFHGFRYVELKGYPGTPTLETLVGRKVHDDVERASEFTTSNSLINKIYDAVVRGTEGNYHGVPTDCPQRDERQGWLGDRAQESWGEAYLFHIAGLYSKWMRDVTDEQDAEGRIDEVSPAVWPVYTDDVSWPATLMMVSDHLYKEYGDRRVIEENYPAMRKWVTHMLTYMKDDLMPRDTGGDWCPPPESPEIINSADPARITDGNLIGSAYFYHVLGLMEQFSTLLGKPADAKEYAQLAVRLRGAFNKAYYHPETGRYSNGSQTSSILPLAMGLAPEEERQKITDALVRRIKEQDSGHLATGLIGTQWLMQTLTNAGHINVAYQIATQKTYPGWGYEVTAGGATTIWELWNSETGDPAMNSENHLMMVGDLTTWLYENLAGIHTDPTRLAFKHIILQPTPVGDLTAVRGSFNSPYGKIASDWHITDGHFVWNIAVPPNATATVYVPTKDAASVIESGKRAGDVQGVTFLRNEPGTAVYEVGSGSYQFEASALP
jgi:alpha-L-rhamnosidase